MEEPLLPLVQHDHRYTSKKDRRNSYDVLSRCAASFCQNTNLKDKFNSPNHLPSTSENANTKSPKKFQWVNSSPSIFTSIKEAPCENKLEGQSHAAVHTPSIARQAIVSIIL
jgi:potassium channel subfamily K, other eukaryote